MTSNMLEIKKSNRSRIIELLYQEDKLSKQDIAYRLGMSLPTVTTHLNNLKKEDLITDDEMFGSAIGRKAKAFRFNAQAKYIIGIEMTPNDVDFVILNLKKEIIAKSKYELIYEKSQAYIIKISELLEALIQKNRIDRSKIFKVAISVPGITSIDHQRIVSSYILDIKDIKVDQISEIIGYPVLFFNSPKAAAIGEYQYNSLNKPIIYLWIGINIGAAIIIDGKLFNGNNCREAEIAHLEIVPDGKLHFCGKQGCFGAYCEIGELSKYTHGDIDLFFKKLDENDIEIRKVWNDYLKYLAMGINSLRTLFDIDIVLGGILSKYIEKYVRDLKEELSQKSRYSEEGEYLSVAYIKESAAAIGAAYIVITDFIEHL